MVSFVKTTKRSQSVVTKMLRASQLNPRLLSVYRTIPQAASRVVVAGVFLVLIGWLSGISGFKSILPGLATMKANITIACILGDVSLWLRANEKSIRQLAILCARRQQGFTAGGSTSYFILPLTAGKK